MPQLPETPQLTPTELPKNAIGPKKSMTFGDLYTQIQSGSLLTPEQEVALRAKITEKYGFNLLGKRKELVTESTRSELEELLADIPGKSDILAKLDRLLPGKSRAAEVVKGATELGKDGLDAAKKATPEGLLDGVTAAGNVMKAQVAKGGEAALSAVGTIVNANGDLGQMTAGVEKLAEVKEGILSTISASMKGVGETIKDFLEATGIMAFLRSIGNFFGLNIPEPEKKNTKDGGIGNNRDKVTNLSEIEYNQLYDVAWRELCKMNTKYSKVVDVNKKEEFKKLLDEYIAKSGITDKKAFLDTFRTGFAGDFSFFKVFSLSRNLPTSGNVVAESDTQKAHLNTFYNSLKSEKVIVPELFQEEIKKDILLRMKDYGWINEDQMDTKRKEIEKKFADPKYAELLRKAENAFITQKEEVSVGAFCIKMLLETPVILFDFLGTVIPWSAVTVNAVDGVFYFGVRAYTALTTRGFNDGMAILTGVTIEELGKVSPEKRLLAITMLHQQGHLAFALAGMAAKAVSTMALMPLYWTQGTGITSMMMQKEQLFGQYEKMATSMNHLTKDILTQPEHTQLFKLDGALRTQMIESEAKLHLVDIWKMHPEKTQAEIHQILSKRMSHTGENLRIRDEVIGKLVNKEEKSVFTRELLSDKFKRSGTNSRFDEMVSQAKGWFVVEQEPHAKLALKRSEDALHAVCNDAIQEGKGSQWFARLASLGKGDIAEMVHNMNRGQVIVNLNGTDPETSLKNLKNVMKEVPAGMQHLFSGLSLVLVGGMAWEAKDDKMKVALQGLIAMHPFAATYILFTEGTTMKDHQWTNPQYLSSMGIAGVFAGVEAVSVLMNARKIGWIPALAQSAATPYRVLIAILRGILNTGRVIQAVKGGGLTAVRTHSAEVATGALKTMKGGGRAALVMGGMVAAVALPGVAIKFYDSEKMKAYTEDLEKKSLISKNGGINWNAITEEAKSWSLKKKEDTLRFAAMQYLGGNVQDITIKANIADILIQPSPDPSQNMTFGVIDSTEIGHMRTLYEKLGYSLKITYSKAADDLMTGQKDKLLKEGYIPEQIAQLEKQIEWIQPA